ncbi:MAG: GTP cyclohydrolase I FolE [Thaumarchaeota archaeon]|nr:MAG: GTP cyclohydrolase I FolE [Nitrososphaerota archaeon]
MDEERVKKLVRELIIEVGEDPTREGLRETPRRIARMYKEIFAGYDSDSELSVQFSEDSDVVIARDIQFYSMCGVFGISKLVRLVEKYSKRLQIQERLTKNIADELYSQGVKGVVVFADAEHLCMKMRGVRNDATLSSSAFRGIYENKDEKESIMALIRKRASNSSF